MKTTWRRITLATTCASILTLSAFAATASGGGGGSNGTVHISEVDDAKGNDPHVGCEFTLEFSGFDEGTGAITSIAIVDRDADEGDAPVWTLDAPLALDEIGTADVPVSIVAAGRSATRTHVELVTTVLEGDVEVPMKTKVFWLSCGDAVGGGDVIIDDGGDDDVIDDDDVIIDDADDVIDDSRDATVEGVVLTGSSPQPASTTDAVPAIETPAPAAPTAPAAPVTPVAPSSAIDGGRPAAALPASYLDQERPAIALPALARTGTDARGLAALGASLMLLGAALVAVTIRWQGVLVGEVS